VHNKIPNNSNTKHKTTNNFIHPNVTFMKKCLFILMVFTMAFTSKIMAQKIANVGTASFTWSTYPWVGGTPLSTENVIINFTGGGSFTFNVPVTISSLTINNSSTTTRAQVTTNSTVNITNALIIPKYVSMYLGASLDASSITMIGSSIIPPVPNPYAASTSNGAGLYCAANIVTTSAFSMGDYCFLGIGHEFGIDFNIPGISTFNTKGNYYYNGTVNQEIGSLPGTVNDLIIDNPQIVSLRQPITVNGTNLLKQGIFDIGANKITYLDKGILNVPIAAVVGKMKADEGILDMRGNAINPITFQPITQNLTSTWFIDNKVGTLIDANVKGVSITPAPALPLIIVYSLEYSTDGSGLVNIGGSTIYTNNNITLQSNNLGTANFGKVSNISGTLVNFIDGTVSIERYLTGVRAWRLIAAPVQLLEDDPSTPTVAASWREGVSALTSTGYGTAITGPTGPNAELDYYSLRGSMKWYDETIGTNGAWVELTNTTTTAIANKKGYMVFVRGDRGAPNSSTVLGASTVLRIKGKVRTGNKEFDILSGKYQCFGNPYPSRIDFRTTTKINMQNAFTSWTPFLPGLWGVGAYKTFYLDVNPWDFNNPTLPNPYFGLYTSSDPNNPITGVPDIRNEIESGEAVFVHTAEPTDGMNGKIIIKESDKTTGIGSIVSRPNGTILTDPRFARTTSLKIKLYSDNVVGTNPAIDISAGTQNGMHFANGAVVNFNDIYSQGVDNDDVAKINNTYDNLSVKEGAKFLEADRRPFIRSFDTVFLNIGLRQAGYRLDISNNFIAVYPSTLSVILKDKYLNTETLINLRTRVITSYTFKVTADVLSQAADRFMIVFRNANTGVVLGGRSAVANTTTTNTTQTLGSNNEASISSLPPVNINTAMLHEKIESTDAKIGIYPNVITNGIVSLHLKNQQQGIYQLQVSNQLGQVIKTETLQVNTSNVLHSINIANAKAGSYQVFIIDKEGNKTTIGFVVN
jgi:hypothetical protein